MAEVTGVVDGCGKGKFGYFVKIGSNYYNSKFPLSCETGDTVTFDSGSTGKYCNKLKVVDPDTVVTKQPEQKQSSFKQVESTDRQGSIESQNALTNTVNFITKIVDNKTALAQTFNFFNITKDEDKNLLVLTVYVHKFYKEIIHGDISVDKLPINDPQVNLNDQVPF